MNKRNNIYHVGNLDLNNLHIRPKTSYSLEGSGLSVSQHPDEWRKIAKLAGETFILSKESANFYLYKTKDEVKILRWCVNNYFLIKTTKYRISFYDEELANECYQEFDTYEQAHQEASDDSDIESFEGYIFGIKGIEYWKSFCSSPVNNALATDYAPIFYAEAHNFDGVWWNESLDVPAYSAPRGVIFQSKVNEWKITQKAI
jgi:hypothetical protein